MADTDTGERAAISGSKLAFYGNVIPTCNRRIPVKRFSGRLVMSRGFIVRNGDSGSQATVAAFSEWTIRSDRGLHFPDRRTLGA